MQPRRPAYLEVVDVLGRGVNAELIRGALQRLGRLQDRECVVEVRDVSRLRGAVVGGCQAKRPGQVQALAPGQVFRRGGPNRTVEVTVQLGLQPRVEVGRLAQPVVSRSSTFLAAVLRPSLADSLPSTMFASSVRIVFWAWSQTGTWGAKIAWGSWSTATFRLGFWG